MKKGDCSSPEKVLGLTLVCVELVVGPNWNRLCGQREALTGQALPGVGGVTPFLTWGGERCFQGKTEAPPLQGADGVSAPFASRTASALLAHSLVEEEGTSTPTASEGGGAVAENTRTERAHQQERFYRGLNVQRITINRRRTLEITCLKEAQFGDGTWQLALFWTF